jgi:sugar phosphate isomerase/epimerase
MKVSVITDEIDNDLEHALDVMAEYGVRSAELRTVWDKNIADAPDEYIDRIKRIIDSRKVNIVGIASPFYKCDLPGTSGEGASGPLHDAIARDFNQQMDILKRCIDIAHLLGTSFVRVFTFWNKIALTLEIEEKIIDAFKAPAELAKKEDVILLIENEHACLTGTGKQTARLLEKIDSPFVQAIWDPGNAFMAGENPFPEGYEAIKRYTRHVHVKDAAGKNGEKAWQIVGKGQCRWEEQIYALKRDGFEAYLSLETHIDKPTKEAASRECLESLIRLANQAEQPTH